MLPDNVRIKYICNPTHMQINYFSLAVAYTTRRIVSLFLTVVVRLLTVIYNFILINSCVNHA